MEEVEELKQRIETMEKLLTQIILEISKKNFTDKSFLTAIEMLSIVDSNQNLKSDSIINKIGENNVNLDNLFISIKNLNTVSENILRRIRYIEDYLSSKDENF